MTAPLRRDCAVDTSARYGDERWEMLFPQLECSTRCGTVPRSVSHWGRSGGFGAAKKLARHGRRLTASRWMTGGICVASTDLYQKKKKKGRERRAGKECWEARQYCCLLRTNVGLMLCPPDGMRRTLPRTYTSHLAPCFRMHTSALYRLGHPPRASQPLVGSWTLERMMRLSYCKLSSHCVA
jgi:hypothetical protein